MYLIHEQDVVPAEVGQQGCQIAWLFDSRAGGDADVDAHLLGDDARQRGLAKARRAVEQYVIQRFCAAARRLDEDGQVLLGLLLADVFLQRFGAQGSLPRVLAEERFGNDRLFVQLRAEINAHVRPSPTSSFSSAPGG